LLKLYEELQKENPNIETLEREMIGEHFINVKVSGESYIKNFKNVFSSNSHYIMAL
jgi:hypothetical protein